MPKFRKKPVVIEARRVPIRDEMHKYPNGVDDEGWLKVMYQISGWCNGRVKKDSIFIPTLEGTMEASPGDWIICGVHDEFYPCKPDIFEATYERVAAESTF